MMTDRETAEIAKNYIAVSVVTVNWNRYEDTCECIDSLLSQKEVSLKIICVDNGSSDNSGQRLQKKYDQIQLLQLNRNLGFAGGYNLGIKQALKQNTNYILIINNDTVADEWMVSKLLREIQASNIGICAPMIYYFENPARIWSSGGYINKRLLMPINSHHDNENLSHPIERTFISGCCYLMKKELIEQVGLFDESFFLYMEDLDFCLRIMQTQWKMKVVPSAKLYHKVAASSEGQYSPIERYYYGLSTGIYYRKYINIRNVWLIVPFRLISAILWTFRLVFSGNIRSLSSYWKGLLTGWTKLPTSFS